MKVSLLRCVCLAALYIQLAACGDQAGVSEAEPALASHSPANDSSFANSGSSEPKGSKAANASADATDAECPDLGAEQTRCGQISLTLKGVGSSCQLVPTVNDLTRPPRAVRFDCDPLELGPNGYGFDSLGHITLMGDTCEALQQAGPHRVTLILSCPP
ncbi:MAG TPA: hypothetical protein VJV79_03575 [Polyangiaceae bacterium]|nr:hypothetical protein [Polyangiaceae bacterium]